MAPTRTPDTLAPHSTEAEQSLLGAMLYSPRAIETAIDAGITPDHYYMPGRGHIHSAIMAVHARGTGVDAVTVGVELDRAGLLDAAGGQRELGRLIADTLGPGAAPNHAAIIIGTHHRRTVMAAAAELIEAARTGDPTSDIFFFIYWSTTEIYTPLPVTPVHELLANPPKRRPVLVDGLLRQGELCVVVAESNVGKSWWCMQLALSLAEGHGNFLGFRMRRKCKVLYLHQEMDAEGAHDRWRTLLGNDTMPTGITDSYTPVHLSIVEETITTGNRRIRRYITAGHEALEARIKTDRPDVVVIDTWGAAFDGNENDKAQTQSVVGVLWQLADKYETAIIVVHHYRKTDTNGRGDPFDAARGSSRLVDAAHTRIVITPHYTKPADANRAGLNEDEARRYADVRFRRRVGRKPDPLSMRFDPETCRWETWTKDTTKALEDELENRVAARIGRGQERQTEDLALVLAAARKNGGGFESVSDAAGLLGGIGYSSAYRMLRLAVNFGHLTETEGPRRSKIYTLTKPDTEHHETA